LEDFRAGAHPLICGRTGKGKAGKLSFCVAPIIVTVGTEKIVLHDVHYGFRVDKNGKVSFNYDYYLKPN
jgi:hypothetical protein